MNYNKRVLTVCYLMTTNEPHAYWWSRYFIEKGYKVHIITFHKPEIKGAEIHYIKSPFKGFLKYIHKAYYVKKLIYKIKPDILHAHYITSQGFLAYYSKYKPLMLSVWGSDIALAPKSNIIIRIIVKLVLKQADIINSPAYHITKKIKQLSRYSKNIYTYQYGIDIDMFDKIRKIKKNKKYRIISIRNFKPLYNINKVLNAMLMLNKKRNDFECIIFGRGNREQTNRIIEFIKKNNMENYVIYKGFVEKEKVYEYLKSSDIFISIPDTDGTPISLLEAMYLRVFPIVSDIEANREWLKENAIFINTDKQLTEAIERVINMSEEEKQKVLNINKQIILKKANWFENMKLTERLYYNLIKGDY